MELKHQHGVDADGWHCLLIVPYGIETFHLHRVDTGSVVLLIVPYGIETSEVAYVAVVETHF